MSLPSRRPPSRRPPFRRWAARRSPSRRPLASPSPSRRRSAGVAVLLLALAASLLAAACSGTGAPSTGTTTPVEPPSASSAPSLPASAVPPVSGGGSGSGGAVGGNPGSGMTPMPPSGWSSGPGGPGGPGASGPQPSPTMVSPLPGLLNVHDVRATAVTARASGGHLIATVSWWSGPPPCSALAEVDVAHAGTAFTLTVREGAQQLGIACPALAMFKATVVDLGTVAAGAYTVAAAGVDKPVTVTVPG